MKILFLNPGAELGGAERSLLLLIESLRAARPNWQIDLIAGAEGPLIERVRASGARAQVLEFPRALATLGDASALDGGSRILRMAGGIGRAGLPSLAYVRRLRNAIAESAPDAIHTNGFKMHILAARARIDGCPLIWHVRDFVSARPVMSHLMRAHANRCSAAIANSGSVAEDLRQVCGRGLNVSAIHNAIDLDVFAPTGSVADLDALSRMSPPSAETIRVGMVATMARWKGHPVFLEAVRRAAKQAPIRAYVVGGSIYARDASQYRIEELRSLAARLGIADLVGFTGNIDNPATAMRALDIVVHASVAPEPFGLVIAEAMACGRATIVSAAGGASEIVTAEQDTLIHNPGDADGLARTIVRLARDPELRNQIGAAARASAERRFSRDRLVAQILPIYEGLVRAAA